MPSRSSALPRDSSTSGSATCGSPAGANPVLLSVRRGAFLEARHRGCWALVDASGKVLASGGAADEPVIVRSTVKCMQALPLLESGAAERFGYDEADLALALASHDGEEIHTQRVARILERLELDPSALRCGAHPPTGKEAREALLRRNEDPTPLHNNCSGKHAGFLALARHLGVPAADYLRPAGAVQERARAALLEVSGADPARCGQALDGCSAPTFSMPLTQLATAFARISDPAGAPGFTSGRRAACERLLAAAARHPELIAGTRRRLCTDLLRASSGRLFPKIGGESLYVVGLRGAGRALVVKIDDGTGRALAPVVLALLARFEFLGARELERLSEWTDPVQRNWARLEVGRWEVTV